MEKNRLKILLVILILFLFIINYSFLDTLLLKYFSENFESETGIVERVIDGDTVVVNDTSVRLLGINSPERGEKFSGEATNFLRAKTLNETVILKFGKEKRDIYDRKLAYIFLNNENINKEIVKKGFANPYFPSGKDKYHKSFFETWEKCIKENKNLCKKSKDVCSDCIVLKKLDYKTQEVKFQNKCNLKCNLTNWEIKDEGRKKFVFPKFILNPNGEILVRVGNKEEKSNSILYWKNEKYVWTRTGDTLFLRDSENELVLWKNY